MYLFLQTREGCARKHANTHRPWVSDLNTNFGRTDVWIKNRPDVTYRSLQGHLRKCIKPDFGGVAEFYVGNVVLIDVAANPDIRQIGYSEWVCAQTLDAGCVGHFLVGDHTGNRCHKIHDARWMIDIAAKQFEMLLGNILSDLRLDFGILRDLEIVKRDRPMLVEFLRAFPLGLCNHLIGHATLICAKSPRNIVGANAKQNLHFLDFIAEARLDLYDASGRHRNYRHRPRNVWPNRPGSNEFRRCGVFLRRDPLIL